MAGNLGSLAGPILFSAGYDAQNGYKYALFSQFYAPHLIGCADMACFVLQPSIWLLLLACCCSNVTINRELETTTTTKAQALTQSMNMRSTTLCPSKQLRTCQSDGQSAEYIV